MAALIRVTEQTVEDLRILRNDFCSSGLLRDDRMVGVEDQKAWWARLDQARNRYFLVAPEGVVMGYVSAIQPADVDVAAAEAEVGVMLTTGTVHAVAEAAFAQLLTHCFDEWGLATVRFSYPPDNALLSGLIKRFRFRDDRPDGVYVLARLDREGWERP